LTKARDTFASDDSTAFGTLGGALAQYAEALSYKEVPTAVNAELAKAGAATTASINAAAKKALQLDKAVLVLVGDAKLIKSQYAATGLPEPVVVGAESVGSAK